MPSPSSWARKADGPTPSAIPIERGGEDFDGSGLVDAIPRDLLAPAAEAVTTLAGVLRGVIAQTLAPRSQGRGRVAVREIRSPTPQAMSSSSGISTIVVASWAGAEAPRSRATALKTRVPDVFIDSPVCEACSSLAPCALRPLDRVSTFIKFHAIWEGRRIAGR